LYVLVLFEPRGAVLLKTYYGLTKPGIIYGNIMTTVAGFLFASKGAVHTRLLLATVLGTALVIGSACAYNNYIDREIDREMDRTKRRGLANGNVSILGALIFATILGVAGFGVLLYFTNLLTLGVGLAGFFDYVVLYGIGKRRTVYGTLVGTIAGATPILAGYTAATNRFDNAALLLFLIMAIWQLPHFYAIALYRIKDYTAAGLPVWPVKKGERSTIIQIVFFVAIFMGAALLLPVFRYVGAVYAAVMIVAGLYWLRLGLQGFRAPAGRQWARGMFHTSLIVLLVFSLAISLDSLLP
jgi:protoheme IX farnesyltransferase